MKHKILFVLSLLFGLMFVNAGLNKFFNYMPPPDNLPEGLIRMSMNMVEIGWLMPLIGFVEIVGGVLFMIGRTRPLGAIIIFPIMVGILFTHITVAPSGIPLAVGLALVLFWVIVENRDKYKALVN